MSALRLSSFDNCGSLVYAQQHQYKEFKKIIKEEERSITSKGAAFKSGAGDSSKLKLSSVSNYFNS